MWNDTNIPKNASISTVMLTHLPTAFFGLQIFSITDFSHMKIHAPTKDISCH